MGRPDCPLQVPALHGPSDVRVGDTEVRNLVLHFEGDSLVRWEGDQFADRDQALIRDVRRQFGPNLPREDKRRRRR